MSRLVVLVALGLLFGLVAASPVRAQPFGYCLPPAAPAPVVAHAPAPPQDPAPFTGARYQFAAPFGISRSYFAPDYVAPTFSSPRYLNPGPYYYTPAPSYSPGYYSYYYTPGFFRY